MERSVNLFALLSAFLMSFSCGVQKREKPEDPSSGNTIPYSIKMVFPHDPEAYTQGLVYYKGKVLESTGSNDSWIAEVNLARGEQDKKVVLDKEYFGEGITVLNNKIYQLTWKDNLGFIYNADNFEEIGTFSYDFEGWGITTDGQHLIISDGSEKIYFLDTLTYSVEKTLTIRENDFLVKQLNELEYVDGFIFANQWETNYLLKIDPQTEQVVGKVDLSPIAKEIKRNYPQADVLNGIAFNPETREMLVTGKRWPKAYILKIIE